MTSLDDTVPSTVLTGFLGAGKTTLLNRLLNQPDMESTAVLINEFGEVGLDNLLVEMLDENTVLLNESYLCIIAGSLLATRVPGVVLRGMLAITLTLVAGKLLV